MHYHIRIINEHQNIDAHGLKVYLEIYSEQTHLCPLSRSVVHSTLDKY